MAAIRLGEQVRVLGDLVQIWHAQNQGAAFSLFQGGQLLFCVVDRAGAGDARLLLTGPASGAVRWLHVVLGVILGGTLGNFADRVRLGYVTDWISVGIGNTRWPTFNVADSSRRGRHPAARRRTSPSSTDPRSEATRMTRRRRRRRPRASSTGSGRARPRSTWRWPRVAGISRAHAQRLIADGRALVDGRRARASDRLRGGERISGRAVGTAGPHPATRSRSRCASPTRTRRCSSSTSRPAWSCTPAPDMRSGTLVHALLGTGPGAWRAAGLHRRRRAARDRASARQGHLGPAAGGQDRCRAGQPDAASSASAAIEKEYLALVRGDAPAPRGRIEAPIGRDPRDRQRMAVVAGGRDAVTEYEVLGSGGGLHAARAASAHRPHPPDPRASRLPAACRSPATCATAAGSGPGGLRAPVPARRSA